MSIFIRLSLLYLALISCSIILVLNIFYDDIKPSIRQASEETLVDSANLMAEFAAPYLLSERKNIEDIGKIFEAFKQRQLNATIWSHVKQKTNLNFYITDNKGQVLFHSSDNSQQGKDYSEWLDVSRTLAGEYGARTTRIEPDNDLTGSMYVAAPIMSGDTLIGVITLIQTHQGIQQFMGPAQTKILVVGGILLLTLVILGLVLARWFNNMLKRLTTYVNKIRQGDAVEPLKLNDPSFNKLSDTLHQMRQDLDGKAYIEQYVHTLTHELKTPLSAISAAAQILETDLDAAQKQRFITNIETEVQRSKQLIERLLLLASIENQQHKIFKPIDFESLLDDEIQSFHSLLATKSIRIELNKSEGFEGYVDGDEFLLRMAVRNLLDNAIDFSFENVVLKVCLESSQSDIELRVINQGEVIPGYALPRLFERFFSTPRPSTGRKSSGLGLCLVNEIAHLHGGEVSLNNTLIPSSNDHLDSAVEAILIIAKEARQP
jgi:two-component system sensor histidine kinase CreC